MGSESADSIWSIPAEIDAVSRLRTARFFVTQRPWLDLYGVRLKPVAPFGSVSSKPVVDPALIHRSLPDELLFEVFARMNPYTLGRAACVCRKWRYTIRNPVFWRSACLKAWQLSGSIENYKILESKYDCSWRKMWLLRPRVRTDGVIDPLRKQKGATIRQHKSILESKTMKNESTGGGHGGGAMAAKHSPHCDGLKQSLLHSFAHIPSPVTQSRLISDRASTKFSPDPLISCLYVSRNTYIRAGVAEWKVTNPVHLVCYFRYMRFFPNGKFLYKNSSQKLKDVARCMNFRAAKADLVFRGHYTLSDDQIEAATLYPGLRPTVLRIRSRLRGTTRGANNRMDLLSLVTSGVNDSEVVGHEENMLGVVREWQDDETHNPDVPAVSHRRGLSPFVFVPFEEVETSVLNLPVDKMDYFVPG
ncbi:hypothetical protein Sjap_021566 [Stephania japonica]|uniref:F-box protein n=1 Tax=Stephania japonica TaxID=461633 RepID=A0AAP0EW15_9MAGN